MGDFVMGAFVTGDFVMGDFVVDSFKWNKTQVYVFYIRIKFFE